MEVDENLEVTSIQEEEQPELTFYEDDTELKKEEITLLFDKTKTLNKTVMFTIKRVGKNKWKKPILEVRPEGETTDFLINISKSIYNELIDSFGSNPKAWIGRTVRLLGTPFNKEIRGEIKTGVELKLVK